MGELTLSKIIVIQTAKRNSLQSEIAPILRTSSIGHNSNNFQKTNSLSLRYFSTFKYHCTKIFEDSRTNKNLKLISADKNDNVQRWSPAGSST